MFAGGELTKKDRTASEEGLLHVVPGFGNTGAV